jgi:hypothetical protein
MENKPIFYYNKYTFKRFFSDLKQQHLLEEYVLAVLHLTLSIDAMRV